MCNCKCHQAWGESEEPFAARSNLPRQEVHKACRTAARLASAISAGSTPAQRGRQWLDGASRFFLRRLGRFTAREIDFLVGCLARVAHAIGSEPPSFQRLRDEALSRVPSL